MNDDTSERHAFALPGTRPQYGPDKLVNVEHIDLHLTPDFEREGLDGICTMSVRALDEPVALLTLDAVDLAVSRVERHAPDSKSRGALGHAVRGEKLDIAFDPAIAPGERATFSIAYRVERPRHGLFFVKPTPAHPEKVTHVWTQSQDEYARYWFPCLDYPYEKTEHVGDDRRARGNVRAGQRRPRRAQERERAHGLSLSPGHSA